MKPANRRRAIFIAVIAMLSVAVVAIALSGGDASRNKLTAGAPAQPGMDGMDMSSPGAAVLSDDAIRTFGVTFGVVEEREMNAEVRAAGAVVVDETRTAQVAPRYSGFAERLVANYTGQRVRRGQVMLEAYSPEILAAQEELLLAERLSRTASGALPGATGSAESLVAGARQRLRLSGVSDVEIDAVLRTGRPRRTVSVYAPISGVVTEKQVVQGQAFSAGQTLYAISDLSSVWIDAEVREADAASIRVGATASIELNALPGRPFSGRVAFIAPVLQDETRTVTARIALPNPEGLARPGMYATVRLGNAMHRSLTVPSAAVIDTGERHVVFVDLGNGRLAPREITPGRVAGPLTEVVSGLERGQRVVTSAQYLLDSESNLADVMRSMISQTGAAGMNMPAQKGPDLQEKGADMKGMKMPADRR
jgi:membrane fusion protein, copper/silver efflux system